MQWDELPEKCYRKTSERSIHKLHWGGKTQGNLGTATAVQVTTAADTRAENKDKNMRARQMTNR